ncbi:ABC transporter substrate-binding protein [Haloarcula sp. CBA1130]|uniref:ABC transporter substrate-binding protein n=1 Tax=unclassified Haloarcula TaxID=2624677 RepID=UPI001248B7EA|nr:MULTISPECIES: ABC transporter substrate-binding protein [unclassified Haloarcula]KAA9396631.1 ABC transporter substrate-binding protein [Haloarcula sp. CBA1130]KAA9397745.1 ABC transporter substrate-binding protein [Haloarcula sp. CBA1129]
MVCHKSVTRRQLLAGTGLTFGAALAGCMSSTESDNTGDSDESTTTEQADSYEACIEPIGCQTLESVPETYIVNNGEWADMAFALGQREGFLTSAYMIPGFLFKPFGLDVPPLSETESLSQTNWDKEIFYEQDPDVILMDPNYMHSTGWDESWDESDTDEISENVAPFFGNNILRRREWHDYKLYSMYEALERLAELFQERERYEALAEVHDELHQEVQSRLPPADERPEIALINSASNPNEGTFYPMRTQVEGVELKPYRDLDIRSAFTADHIESGTIDYETLLEVDPEVIVVHWGIGTTGDTDSFSPEAFAEQFVTPFEEDSTGSRLSAVQKGNVYPGAFGSQGPLVNLLQTEVVAQQLYPEEFGEFDAKKFPEVAADKQLFDRQRVTDIIQGHL